KSPLAGRIGTDGQGDDSGSWRNEQKGNGAGDQSGPGEGRRPRRRQNDQRSRRQITPLVGAPSRMRSVATVTIHASQFPEKVRRDLMESLRTGKVNHKFHYDSVKQTQKWLALHQAYSPSRTEPDCAAIYDRSFEAVAEQIEAKRVHLI